MDVRSKQVLIIHPWCWGSLDSAPRALVRSALFKFVQTGLKHFAATPRHPPARFPRRPCHGYTKVRNRIPPPNGNSCPGHTHNKLFANRRQKFEPATKRYVPARLTAGLKYHFSSSQLKFCIKGLANPDLKTTRVHALMTKIAIGRAC